MKVMHFSELPFYLTVKKIVKGNNVRIQVESTIHVQKVVEMPTQFSLDFIRSLPSVFRSDVLAWVVKHYGLKPEPLRYS